VPVYALTSSQLLHETLDLFLTREAAEAELREILEDEPDWKGVLRIVPIELDERDVPPRHAHRSSRKLSPFRQKATAL